MNDFEILLRFLNENPSIKILFEEMKSLDSETCKQKIIEIGLSPSEGIGLGLLVLTNKIQFDDNE